MRIIKQLFLTEAAKQYPKAEKYLVAWSQNARRKGWNNMVDVRKDYPRADLVRMKSGKPVFVFDVCGNDYRLIAALHFNKREAYVLRFLTHAEYNKNNWKNEL